MPRYEHRHHAARATRRNTAVATLVRTAAAALLVVVATCLGASPALAAPGDVTWTVRTASNSYGADRSSFGYTVNPGGLVKDAMVVANHGTTPLTLVVYTADGFTSDTGQLDLLTKDKKSIGIGAWAHADQDSITVQPGTSMQVPFSVTVPRNATPGDYVGGIVTSLTQASEAEGINVDRRLGIRIKLRVGGALKPGLAIEDLHVRYTGRANPFGKGGVAVTYRIHNTGNAILSAKPAVSVTGPFGMLRTGADAVASPPELLPGESWQLTIPVRGVAPAVLLTATATLTPLLTDASGSTTTLTPVRVTTHSWAVPWTLLLLVVVLIAVIVAAVLLTRRARKRSKLREDVRVREAVDQALRDRNAAAH